MFGAVSQNQHGHSGADRGSLCWLTGDTNWT